MIIAEIGTSHNGSLEKAMNLIDAAHNAGADAIKLQWVYADEILHPNTGSVDLPSGKTRLYDTFKTVEMPLMFFESVAEYAHEQQLQFLCSPFGEQSLRELVALKADAIKIASPELNHFPLLHALSDYRTVQKAVGDAVMPVIISTGVSKLSDIEKALDILGKENLTLLHCVTSYPAPETEYNVSVIENLSRIFGVPCGISDHSLDPVLVPSLAIAFGAVTIEKHITLSKNDSGLDDKIALNEAEFSQMVHAVHQCEAAIARYGKKRGAAHIIKELKAQYGKQKVLNVIGKGVKELAPSELDNYGKTNRSLHFMRNMSAGTFIGDADVGVLRTEKNLTKGISPEYLELVLDAKLSRDVHSGDGVQWQDFLTKKE